MTETPAGYVTVIWEARARPGSEAAMKAFLIDAVTPSRHDAGNIDYDVHEVEGQPGTFVIFERWETRAALAAHLGAPRMRALVPQLQELMDGSVEDGLRFLTPLRPAAAG